MSLPDIFLIIAISALTVVTVLVVVWLAAPKVRYVHDSVQPAHGEIFVKFVDGTCVEASPSALELFHKDAASDIEVARVRELLAQRFDALTMLLSAEDDLSESLPSTVSYDQASLLVERDTNSCSFRVADPAVPNSADRHSAMVGRARQKQLYENLNKIPTPIWINSDNGNLQWSNRSYSTLVQTDSEQAAVFEFDSSRVLRGNGDRVSIPSPQQTDKAHWYDISTIELDQGTYLSYATNIDGIIAAETAQRKFVQTLAKTFAQLSIGLAIFDRERRLVLFNPALVDLTALPAQFLSVRPNLQSFFDKLRENRIMPEPKDYASWRRQIADLVVRAEGGDYQETWGLPSGLTYRVTGRPHPDGAIAILIEDITAEISLTRRFKGQIELGNSALETLADAIIVFGPDGAVAFWNSAFKRFCQLPDNALAADHDLPDILKLCARKFGASPELDKLKRALRNPAEIGTHKGRISQNDGPPVSYEVRSHDGTAVIVTLHTSEQPARKAFPELTSAN